MTPPSSPEAPVTALRPDAERPQDAHARRIASEELLRGERFVEIAHNGETYRLQATRLGKLILTK